MAKFLSTYGSALSTLELLVIFVFVALLECVVSRRSAASTISLRWFGNISMMILGTFAVRLVFPVVDFSFSRICVEHGWGLLNHVPLPGWFKWAITFAALDLAVYARHRLSHHVSFMWLLHRVHHTDDDVDFTTTLRFHPLDAVLISAVRLALIAALGAPPLAVLSFQLLSTLVDFMSHANVRIPAGFDRLVRRFFITPDMHLLHHSQGFDESNSNFGSVFPWWDRWFGTYMAESESGTEQLRAGLPEFTERKHQTLPWMLAQPFLKVAASDAILLATEEGGRDSIS